MDNFLRRLRGTLGMALVWGAGWAAVVGLIPGGLSWLEAVVVVVTREGTTQVIRIEPPQ